MVHSFQYNPNPVVSGKALCRCGQRLPSQFILSKADDVEPDAGKAGEVSLGWLKGVPLNSGCLRKDCCWKRDEERLQTQSPPGMDEVI